MPVIGEKRLNPDGSGEPQKFFAPGRWDTDWEALAGDAVQYGTTAEKIALGDVAVGTPFFDQTLARLERYGSTVSGDQYVVTKQAAHLPTLGAWVAPGGMSGLEFKITTSPTDTTDNAVVVLPDGVTTRLYMIGTLLNTTGVPSALIIGWPVDVTANAGVLTLEPKPLERRWVSGLNLATVAYDDIANTEALVGGATTAIIQSILVAGSNTRLWEPVDAPTTSDVWPEWGNADGVMTTGRKVVKAETIILPDSANSTPAPVHNTRMSVATPAAMTWSEWATAGGLWETEGNGPTSLNAPNSVAGDSSDTLVWQYDSGSDSWSAKFGSDATAAGVNVTDTSASGYQDIPGTNLREQWGVETGSGVTFPAPFKTGTVPTVIPVALSAGDNQNVSLQSVNHTGFNTWVVRNESDVGITTPTIHWVAKGEKP